MVDSVDSSQSPMETQQDAALNNELMSKDDFILYLKGKKVGPARAEEIFNASQVSDLNSMSLNSEELRIALKAVESFTDH